MYSEGALNGKNKGQVVDIAIELQKRLADATSGELTAGAVEKELLAMSNKVASIADNAQKRSEAHAEALATIEADKIKEIKELELKHSSESGIEGEELLTQFAALQEKVDQAKGNLTYGLRKAEIDAKHTLDKIEANLLEQVEKLESRVATSAETLEQSLSKNKEELTIAQDKHSKIMEQLAYDQSIAERDGDINFATSMCDKHGKTLVDTADYTELVAKKDADAKEVAATIAKEVAIASASIRRTMQATHDSLESSTSTQIALLQNDKQHLLSTTETQATRIAELTEQVKGIPAAIAEAVGKANSNITVNQDAAKK